ncbi:MAG: type II secretion system inner membrane protein GspF [Gammaproteobacteria bacterium]
MATFEYSALTSSGETKKGVLEADSEKQARRQLREQSLTPMQVAESRSQRTGGRSIQWRAGKLPAEQLVLLTRLLGTLLRSGLPVDDALAALSKQSDSRTLQRVVLGIRGKVLEGHSLAESMNEFPLVFPEVYRATVGAGEQTRHLPLVLMRLAEHVEAREKLRKSLRLAMIYPVILTLTALLVVVGLLTYVVPEVVQVFDGLDRELPPLTVALITASNFFKTWGLLVLCGVIAMVFCFRWALNDQGFKTKWHSLVSKIPLIGKLIIDADIGRFTRMLSIMLSSSVTMIDALVIASKSIYLLPMRARIDKVTERVREGESLNQALEDVESMPNIVPHLVLSGESSGNLEEMLDTAAETLEYRVQNIMSLLLSLAEPLLILILGAIVLLIVIAILLPIFDMNQMV